MISLLSVDVKNVISEIIGDYVLKAISDRLNVHHRYKPGNKGNADFSLTYRIRT
jgi:cyanate lyase